MQYNHYYTWASTQSQFLLRRFPVVFRWAGKFFSNKILYVQDYFDTKAVLIISLGYKKKTMWINHFLTNMELRLKCDNNNSNQNTNHAGGFDTTEAFL